MWAVLGSPSPSLIFLYCKPTWKAFRVIMQLGCLLSYSLLASHLGERSWSFTFADIEPAVFLLSLSSLSVSLFGFCPCSWVLCTKSRWVMDIDHQPLLPSLCFCFISCFPCLLQLLFHAQNKSCILLLLLLLFLIMLFASAYPVMKGLFSIFFFLSLFLFFFFYFFLKERVIGIFRAPRE